MAILCTTKPSYHDIFVLRTKLTRVWTKVMNTHTSKGPEEAEQYLHICKKKQSELREKKARSRKWTSRHKKSEVLG